MLEGALAEKVAAISVPALLAVAIIGGCAFSNSSNEAKPTHSPSASVTQTPKAKVKTPKVENKAPEPNTGGVIESDNGATTFSIPGFGSATVYVPDSHVRVQARAPMAVPAVGSKSNKLEMLRAKRAEALDVWNKAKAELEAANAALNTANDKVSAATRALEDAQANRGKAEQAANELAAAKQKLADALDAQNGAKTEVKNANAELADAMAKADQADQVVAGVMKQADFDWAKLSKAETETLVAAIVQENINAYRAQAGLPPLPVTVELNQSAYSWSKHMSDTKDQRSRDEWLVHADSGNAEQVLCDQPTEDGCWGVNESIAYRSMRGTPRDMAVGLFNAWKNSLGDNMKMLSYSKNYAGIGVFIDSNGTYWATSRSYGFEEQKPGAYTPDNAGLIGESTTAGAETYSGDKIKQTDFIKVFPTGKKAEDIASVKPASEAEIEAAKAAAKAAHEKVDEAKAKVATAESNAEVADSNVDAAKAEVDAAQAKVDQFPDPAAIQANLDAARAEAEAASARVAEAAANEQAAHEAYDAADAAYQAEAAGGN